MQGSLPHPACMPAGSEDHLHLAAFGLRAGGSILSTFSRCVRPARRWELEGVLLLVWLREAAAAEPLTNQLPPVGSLKAPARSRWLPRVAAEVPFCAAADLRADGILKVAFSTDPGLHAGGTSIGFFTSGDRPARRWDLDGHLLLSTWQEEVLGTALVCGTS